MNYCTHCGEKTSEKKICKSCGVKLYSTHHFCHWCGTAFEQDVKKCPYCGENVKKSFILFVIIKYIIGAFFLLTGLVSLVDPSLFSIPLILFGILLLPVVNNFIKRLTCKKGKIHKIISTIRVVILFILIPVMFITAPSYDTDSTTSDNISNSTTTETTTKEAVIKSSQAAIAAAKVYVSDNSRVVAGKIADECGFKRFYSPDYATYDCDEDFSSWTVQLNGNMGGYIDDYGTDFEQYKFTVNMRVYDDGEISIISVEIIE